MSQGYCLLPCHENTRKHSNGYCRYFLHLSAKPARAEKENERMEIHVVWTCANPPKRSFQILQPTAIFAPWNTLTGTKQLQMKKLEMKHPNPQRLSISRQQKPLRALRQCLNMLLRASSYPPKNKHASMNIDARKHPGKGNQGTVSAPQVHRRWFCFFGSNSHGLNHQHQNKRKRIIH